MSRPETLNQGVEQPHPVPGVTYQKSYKLDNYIKIHKK